MGSLGDRIAILYQAARPPLIDGSAKPLKPGGYSDSGADIASQLHRAGFAVVTPVPQPDPSKNFDWVFPDDAAGIDSALRRGATVLWANTVLFAGHPLEAVLARVRVVGQHPRQAQEFDDKWHTNTRLRANGLPVAAARLIGPHESGGAIHPHRWTPALLQAEGLRFPLIVKPVRGRGSQGVVRVDCLAGLHAVTRQLLYSAEWIGQERFSRYGHRLMVEEYLPGEELTLTVMPPGAYRIGGDRRVVAEHWPLPPVRRFHHHNGIAPYNGVVAVVRNSQVLSAAEANLPELRELAQQCAQAARLVGARAPIRIDCRRSRYGRYLLFDLNMKPNMTGAGRPGREDQDSLTALAARAIGWSFSDLLSNMLAQAWGPQDPAACPPEPF